MATPALAAAATIWSASSTDVASGFSQKMPRAPNSIAPLLVYTSIAVATNVLLEAALSYLGLGVQPPTPSWGNLLNNARSISVLSTEPWQWGPAAILIVLFVLAVNFVGDGIRDAVDPRRTHG